MKHLVLPLLCLIASSLTSVAASSNYQAEQLVFYQSGDVIEERLPDFSKLSDYIKRLQDASQRFFATNAKPEMLDIVVAVRPGRQSRIWIVSSVNQSDAKHQSLRSELEKVKPCDVRNGPIAFAIAGKVAGGDGKKRISSTPMPVEWQRAVDRSKGSVVIPDGILDTVWPRR